MNANAVKKYLRPLPAVIVLGAALLALKATGLALDARAASAGPGNSAAHEAGTEEISESKAPPRADAAGADGEDSSSSAAEVDVLTSLSERRTELDSRAQALDMRANLIAAAEKRVDGKIADLKAFEGQIRMLLGQRDAAEEKQIESLVKVYSAMKPKDAARIFNALDESVLLAVAGAMKPDALAAVMAQMDPKQAEALTVKLAGRLKLPKEADLPAAPQPAAPVSAPGQTASAEASAVLPQAAPDKISAGTPAATPDKPQAGASAGNSVPAGG